MNEKMLRSAKEKKAFITYSKSLRTIKKNDLNKSEEEKDSLTIDFDSVDLSSVEWETNLKYLII